MSALADEASARAPGDAADAVVWEEVAFTAESDAGLTTAFCLLLVAAAWIAAIGILTDSLVLIVGAMVLGPEYALLSALATGLVLRSKRLCLRAMRTIALGTVVAVATTALFVAALAIVGIADLDDTSHEATGFIARPDVWSLLVAPDRRSRRRGVSDGTAFWRPGRSPDLGHDHPGDGAVCGGCGVRGVGVALAAAIQLAINMLGIIVGSTLVLEIHRRRRGLPVGESVAATGDRTAR